MGLPTTLLCDENGDVSLASGLQLTTTLADYVVQRLAENLGFFLGEWFLDLRQGIPILTKIVGEAPDFPLIDSLYRRAILLTPGVGSISALNISFDRPTRKLAMAFECILTDGAIITQADLAKLLLVDF